MIVVSNRPQFRGMYLSEGDPVTNPVGGTVWLLNSYRAWLGRTYSDNLPRNITENQDGSSFVPATNWPTFNDPLIQIALNSGGDSETPFSDWDKAVTHAEWHPGLPTLVDESRVTEFDFQPTLDAALAFLAAVDFDRQWTSSPDPALHSRYAFDRYPAYTVNAYWIKDGTIKYFPGFATPIPATFSSAIAPGGFVTIANEGVHVANGLPFGISAGRSQVEFLTPCDYFMAETAGTGFRFLTNDHASAGTRIEIPAPSVTALPAILAGGTQPAEGMAVIVVVGVSFAAYVAALGGTVVAAW